MRTIAHHVVHPVVPRRRACLLGALAFVLLTGCSDEGPELAGGGPSVDGPADTGYVNPGAVEVHVQLEADVAAGEEEVLRAPMELYLFGMRYLNRQAELHIEMPDESTADRVEWLVDGEWINRAQAGGVDRSRLTRFRVSYVNAVVYRNLEVRPGDVYEAEVPLRPFTVLEEVGDGCSRDPDVAFLASYYWWDWSPELPGCTVATQTLTATVTEVMPINPPSYPEYDQLWEDGRLDVVVLFGRSGGAPLEGDSGWRYLGRLAQRMEIMGFVEVEATDLGRRFEKTAGGLTTAVDLYGPDVYEHVADDAHFRNWQRAVSEHEIIMYNGHSELGGGTAFTRVEYPDFYQIFHLSACLGYEYYSNPILEGKGSWAAVDVVSNLFTTSEDQALSATTGVLLAVVEGFENGGERSWQDILAAVTSYTGNVRFGVNGARGNCFSPQGDLCDGGGPIEPGTLRFESCPDEAGRSCEPAAIPDGDPDGLEATIEVGESLRVRELELVLDVTHGFVADLEIELEHDGVVASILEGGAAPGRGFVIEGDHIVASVELSTFFGMDAAGGWTLRVVDSFSPDEGRLNSWALSVLPR